MLKYGWKMMATCDTLLWPASGNYTEIVRLVSNQNVYFYIPISF